MEKRKDNVSEESCPRHSNEHLYSSIKKKINDKKQYNTEKAKTYEGLETDNQAITGYLYTCSKHYKYQILSFSSLP